MTSLRETCPVCDDPLVITCWDASFTLTTWAGDHEQTSFGIPGGLCQRCHQLYVDPDLLDLLGLADARCTFAIENDVIYRDRMSQRELH